MSWTPPDRTDHNYIRTISGQKFWPLNPRPEDVYIEDIASALSLMCRYNGHLPYLYSVGQHSLNVYYHSGLPWGLLHDATEAYLPDVPRPIKDDLPFFRVIEQRLHVVIAQALKLDADGIHAVKQADTEVLRWEYARFRPQMIGADMQPPQSLKPDTVVLDYVPPEIVQARFLYAYITVKGGEATCGND